MRLKVFQLLNIAPRTLIAVALSTALSAGHAWAIGLDDEERQTLQSKNIGPFVVDTHTGVALGGFDPVEFFLSKRTVDGKPDLQVSMRSGSLRSTFYFRTIANRDAFLQSPQIYLPRFGGHCAMQLARGREVSGNPRIWALYRNRLFLFHSAALRDEWLKSPGGFAAKGEKLWHPNLGIEQSTIGS
ncbi:MAG: YHS domain-containing (seleno)protein [Pseudomonadota bacterium]